VKAAALHGVRAVTFDAGGTLLDPWPSVGHVYADAAAECGLGPFDPQELAQRFFAAWRERGDFGYTRQSWQRIVHQTFTDLIEPSAGERLFASIYQRFARPDAWRVHEDVAPCLDRLRKQGLKLAVVSNFDERLEPLLHGLELADRFDCIVASGPLGMHKPAPEIFQHAARCLELPPATILHVGDSDVEDVQGARGAGMGSRLLQRRGPAIPGEVLTSLSELLPDL